MDRIDTHYRIPTRRRAGMTLVELLVSLAIFAVISAVVIGFLTGSRHTYENTSDRAGYQQSLRAVFSLITREVRSAGCDPAEVGVDRFPLAAADALRCQMDLDGDGNTADVSPDEDITYTFQAGDGELRRTTLSGDQTILRGVQAVTFSYFDADGNLLAAMPLSAADRREVRYVGIAITGETPNGEPVTYSTRVLVRNG
jgi:prepilin-type N-terminal cleavage/methylation domain-containing protein